jgi:S1-C subfamily serine protease
VTAAGSALDARVAAYDPATGLVLLETGPPGGTPVPISESGERAGALAVATATWDSREIVAPLFVSRSGDGGYTVAAGQDLPPGLPVFTADGALLAVLGGQDRPRQALAAAQAVARLTALAAAGTMAGSIGIAVQDIPAALTAAFGDTGVVVTRVVSGGPADQAGLAAGDVLLGIGGTDLASAAAAPDALRAGTPGSPMALRIRRDGRERGVQVTPAPAFAVAALARGERLEPPAGVHARSVLSRAAADQAGLPESSRVLAVNGTPVAARAAVDRMLLRARAPLPVLVEHEGRRYFAAVEAVP